MGWYKLSAVGTGLDSAVYALEVFNGNLYAAGFFANAGSTVVNRIAKWNGSSWVSVGTGTSGNIFGLKEYNNELYAAGTFTVAGGVAANNIAKWNGSAWAALGTGLSGGSFPGGGTLEVYNNELYVIGGFSTAGGNYSPYIAKWHMVGAGIKENATINSVSVFPNPATDKLIVESINGEVIKQIIFYNSLGQSEKMINANTGNSFCEINISEFTPGIYFYEVLSSQDKISKGKIIKE